MAVYHAILDYMTAQARPVSASEIVRAIERDPLKFKRPDYHNRLCRVRSRLAELAARGVIVAIKQDAPRQDSSRGRMYEVNGGTL